MRCGIKMVQAICRRRELPKSVMTEVLDMAAIGTVSDIVSLTDENRTIVKYGLMKANEGSRRALKLLMDAVSAQKHHLGEHSVRHSSAYKRRRPDGARGRCRRAVPDCGRSDDEVESGGARTAECRQAKKAGRGI